MMARALAALLLAVLAATAANIEDAVRRIDAVASDAEGRLLVSTAIAGRLKMHRNHVVLLRRQSGKSYGRIFVTTLRERGAPEKEIEREINALLAELASGGVREEGVGIGPVLTVSTGVDHSAAATYFSVVPEAGFETRHAGLVFGAPLYRVSADGTVSQGVGDVYTAGFVRGSVAGLDLSANLSVGFPTGDVDLGLGAGKTSVDGRFTVARSFERGRVFASAGGSNFLFNNFIYQRPFISDGPAAHFAGGGEVYPVGRLAVGLGMFAVEASGVQEAITSPASTSTVDLADRGVNAWATVALSRQVWLEFAVARSFPLELTTARAGVVFSIFGRGR
ncbi:MAG TPA: hypothetical protein VN442_06715 [Bryobacteraceae bacterium]|nr:hypothetical protein [Bryobacteraceae bacterium]